MNAETIKNAAAVVVMAGLAAVASACWLALVVAAVAG